MKQNDDTAKSGLIKFKLRTKFMISILVLEFTMLVAIIFAVEHQMRKSVLEEFKKRGFSITKNMAAVNKVYMATYNYVNIEQNVKQIAKDNELFYGAVLFYDGELAAYSGHEEIKRSVLEGPLHKKKILLDREKIYYGRIKGTEYCEIVVPVFLKEEKWGTVRCGFSLNAIQAAIVRTRVLLISLGCIGLIFGYLTSLFLAGKITKPIGTLVDSVEAISNGEYDVEINLDTHDEIAYLGRRFTSMKNVLKDYIQLLVDTNKEVTSANERMEAEIIERKRTEIELRKAMKAAEAANIAKSNFLNNVSHELRTPMNGIMGMAELLNLTELSEKQKIYAASIQQSSDSLLYTINGILDYSLIESGKLKLVKSEFNLHEIIESSMDYLANTAYRKGLELGYIIKDEVPLCIYGDSARIRQVLMIVSDNAVKYTSEGFVFIEVDIKDNSYLRFCVKDSGIGISPQTLDSIFKVFSQADESLTREYEGLGMGLSIAGKLTEMMEGDIFVKSIPEEGSTFTFTIKIEDRSIDQKNEIIRTAGLKKSSNVLIVDENKISCEVMGSYFDALGISYALKNKGKNALEYIKHSFEINSPVDIVFIDLMLADMNGMALGRRIMSHPEISKITVVMMTPVNMNGEEKYSLLQNFPLYLDKPIKKSKLIEIITSYAGKSDGQELVENVSKSSVDKDVFKFNSNVLVVEDNPVNLMLARQKLINLGCTVDEARNGKEAVDMFERGRYDFIAMDCQMPVLDGYEATRIIREKEKSLPEYDKRVPIVAITAHAMEGAREKCISAGMDDYMTKPFTLEQLSVILKKWLTEEVFRVNEKELIKSDLVSKVAKESEIFLKTAENKTTNKEVKPESPVDWETMKTIMGGKVSLMKQVIEIYLNDSLKHIKKLRDSGEKSDVPAMKSAAHGFKSGSANVGAKELSRLCGELEIKAGDNSVEDASIIIGHIVKEYGKVRTALEEGLPKIG